jgi:two-component system chemotaxis response regulator CheB
MQIQQASDGDVIKQGHAYVAPGTDHLYITHEHGEYRCRLSSADPVNRHKPSVDVLFQSVAREATDGSMGVLLTGMGKDGAQGLLEMRNRGFVTIAQDESSSVVWGMPGTAVQLDAAVHVKPLASIADLITSQV